jgi:hypothetical protein
MATSTANDSRCATCGKAAGTFTCRGCSKDFCLRHTNEHRQELSKQMDENVIPLHDQLRQNIDEQTKKPRQHPLMKRVDEWEQDSIEKIHQAANDARTQLLDIVNKHTTEMKKSLEQLTQQLKTARDDDHFFENDLKEWIKKLDVLKKDLITPQTISIQYDTSTTPFISKILISQTPGTSDDCFEQAIGNIKITNNGTVIIHNQTNSHASVRGKCEYSTGEHRLRFTIENLSQYKWIFLGVVSKTAPALATGPAGKTSYAFSGQDTIWRDGVNTSEFNGYKSDLEINDTIELLINCDQRKIRLINERTQKTDNLDVDIDKCPFPWKLSVGLFHLPGERIRILK